MLSGCDMHTRTFWAAADPSVVGRTKQGGLGHGGLEASSPDLLGLLDNGPSIVMGALVANMLDQLQGLQGHAVLQPR